MDNQKMDMLAHIFMMQNEFDLSIIKDRNLEGISFEEWIQKEILAMVSELGELMDEVNFKWWKNPKPVDMDSVREELADIMHFFISMCLKTGMTAEDLYSIYKRKNRENFLRQEGKSEKKGYAVGEL